MTEQSTEGFADVSGGRIWYQSDGAGEPVILLHAGIVDSRMWEAQIAPFAERYRLIRYDARGFGRSDAATRPFSHSGDLLKLLEVLGIERASLVGCSMGGSTAVDFALEHPEMVDALVPVAAGLGGYEWPDDPRGAAMEEAFEAGDLGPLTDLILDVWAPLRADAATDESIRRMTRENLAAELGTDELLQPLKPPAIERLEAIRARTLVVVADHDEPDIGIVGDILVERIPGATKVVIADSDHLIPTRQPAAFNDAVLEFLDGARRA